MAMEYVIQGYQPEALFRFFEEISAIPRGSGNEKGVADYLVAFAEKRGLFCLRDRFDNVYIRKPAAPGYEEREGILLQGHTDMVCEKNAGVGHDFQKEGLALAVEGEWLFAKGTTLGGDDGVAVAAMLTALDDDTLKHPELECLFTTGEETGLFGAEGFDCSVLRAKKLINLDSEEEGVATVSCAGGIEFHFTLKPERLPLPRFTRPLILEISGLFGGHSGADIGFERGNANLLLLRILAALYKRRPFRLITLSGGSRGNAIPRESRAVIFTPEPEEDREFLKKEAEAVFSLLPEEDRGGKLKIGKAKDGEYEKALSFADTEKILSLGALMPNGVLSRIPADLAATETSDNLGVIRDDGEKGILMLYHGRSSEDKKTDWLADTAERAAKALGFELNVSGRYAGWPMKKDSPLAAEFMEAAREVLGPGANPRTEAIHAGLECGIFCSKKKDLDAISVGPTLRNIHTPQEKLSLPSFERMWRIVRRLLEGKTGE